MSIVLLLSIEAKLGVHCTHKGLTHALFTFTLHKVCPERPIKGLILLYLQDSEASRDRIHFSASNFRHHEAPASGDTPAGCF